MPTFRENYLRARSAVPIQSRVPNLKSLTGAWEPWHQGRRGSHKILPNGAKIGLGSHKFSEVIDWKESSVWSEDTAVTISWPLVQ